jgi:hypothetical protein
MCFGSESTCRMTCSTPLFGCLEIFFQNLTAELRELYARCNVLHRSPDRVGNSGRSQMVSDVVSQPAGQSSEFMFLDAGRTNSKQLRSSYSFVLQEIGCDLPGSSCVLMAVE